MTLPIQDAVRRVRVDGADVHTLCRPVDMVGGDVCDVMPLGDTHLAITLADATGHDQLAGMLCAYFARSVRSACSTVAGRVWPDPAKVLERGNRDILAARLRECLFVTAAFAVYDLQSRVISWARGGAPYPILVRPGVRPRRLKSEGVLLGALPDARFEVCRLRLLPGDTLVFHTDGLDAALLEREARPLHTTMDRTTWFKTLGRCDIEAHLGQLDTHLQERDDATIGPFHDTAPSETVPAASGALFADDVTVVALQVHEPSATRPISRDIQDSTHQPRTPMPAPRPLSAAGV